ncbi:MAG: hypothetical protein Q8Q29_08465 [Actinomycetota bacterium]|nr:hypothetical protein [Actinomycetota bacterium]
MKLSDFVETTTHMEYPGFGAKPKRYSLARLFDLMSGRGKTATEAQQVLHDELRAWSDRLRANPSPILITTGPPLIQGLVWVRPDGWWTYGISRSGEAPGCAVSATWTRREAEYHCRRHLAQDVYGQGRTGMDLIHQEDIEGRMEHARWVTWQNEYRAAKAAGATDDEARVAANNAE